MNLTPRRVTGICLMAIAFGGGMGLPAAAPIAVSSTLAAMSLAGFALANPFKK